jgi:signal transduction histidine kinase
VRIQFAHQDIPPKLPDGVAINLFRVLQEALSNAVKHSGASWYRVSLRGIDDHIELEVMDNGRGFDVRGALAASGLGLVSMQERLRLVNGELVIESKPGNGTLVRAVAPVRQDLPGVRRRQSPAAYSGS